MRQTRCSSSLRRKVSFEYCVHLASRVLVLIVKEKQKPTESGIMTEVMRKAWISELEFLILGQCSLL